MLSSKKSDIEAKLAALDKSQAVIEFRPDGTIVTANDNFLKTVGYTLSEIAGAHHSHLVSQDEKTSAAADSDDPGHYSEMIPAGIPR